MQTILLITIVILELVEIKNYMKVKKPCRRSGKSF